MRRGCVLRGRNGRCSSGCAAGEVSAELIHLRADFLQCASGGAVQAANLAGDFLACAGQPVHALFEFGDAITLQARLPASGDADIEPDASDRDCKNCEADGDD